jgi:CRAL/TRIO, N-terminal domain/CRAL/TRIO domain
MRRAVALPLRTDRAVFFHSSRTSRLAFPRRHTFLKQTPPLQFGHATRQRASAFQTGNKTLESSSLSFLSILIVVAGSVLLFEYTWRGSNESSPSTPPLDTAEVLPQALDDADFLEMPILPGYLGNLTPDQETKLRELWAATLKTFGLKDPSPNGPHLTQDEKPVISEAEAKDDHKKKRRSIFARRHGDSESSPSRKTDDSDDKYGQVKEYQQILATQSPESLRVSFWTMVKADHPDVLLLRFLRARKWDVDKALVMMISTMSWRGHEIHLDDDIILHGEGGALRESQSTDPNVKREGHDFLEQMKLGKSFLHGTDKEGRPICVVRARLHHGGDQTERSMERYTVYVIETARLVIRPPTENAVSYLPSFKSDFANF